MITEFLSSSPSDLARAAQFLREGLPVAFPTETVYGLGADATRDSSVAGIYRAKGRPSFNPLIVHVRGAEDAARWASEWSAAAQRLAEAFWPGPLTLIVPAVPGLSRVALAGGSTVGLRAPAHPVAQALLEECGLPLAAPSANRSGSLSPTTAAHVRADLDGRIAAVVDGGPCRVGIESTVLSLAREKPQLLRPGAITPRQLEEVLGRPVQMLGKAPTPEEGLPSPGLLDRHYAPRIPLRPVPHGGPLPEPHRDAALILVSDLPTGEGWAFRRRLPMEPQGYASALYGTLWDAQESSAEHILLELPPSGPEWQAIHDRLRRAITP